MATEKIEISYDKEPRGQVGKRPRKISLNDSIRFTTKDPGVLTVEFIGKSPLKDNVMVVKADTDVTAVSEGRFAFRCHLDRDGMRITFGDPQKPAETGGELDIGP